MTARSKTVFAFLATAAVALVFAPAADAQRRQTRELTVQVGEQTSISAAGVRSYSEGTRGIVDVRLTRDESQFILVGQNPGQTSLLLIMGDGSQVQYRVTVPGAETEEEEQSGVQARENIRLDLYFVQLSDTYNYAIGINWPSSIGSDQSIGNFQYQIQEGMPNTTSLSLIAQSVLPRLDISQSNGWARIYRQASVITANGEQASFSSGGELNVMVAGAIQGTLQQIPYGTILNCTPRYDPETGRIEIQIQADVSDLTDDNGTGVPGRLTNTVNTLVNLELGEAVVLGGIIARAESRTRTGLPGLSQIPILGALFGSHSRRFEESEALVFIVPTVVDAVPLTQRNRIEEAIRFYEDYSGGVDEVELHEQPRIGRQRQNETPPRNEAPPRNQD